MTEKKRIKSLLNTIPWKTMMNIFATDNTCRELGYTDVTMQHAYHLSAQFIKVYWSLWKGLQSKWGSAQTQPGYACGGVCACVKFSYLTDPFHGRIDRRIAVRSECTRTDKESTQGGNILCWKGWRSPLGIVRSKPNKPTHYRMLASSPGS